ncbi:MAG: hypothetical protein ACYCZO_02330, partial [Daejeonella sp.]
ILSLYVRIRYSGVSREYMQFYKDTYYCQIVQLRHLFKDFFIRKKHKTISFNGEFAPELQFVLPFAYWHFKNGTLKKTRSSIYTSQMYFFSPDHEEIFNKRTDEGNYNFEMPRVLYSQDYDMKKWCPVPFKEHYKNEIFIFEKPILIIANRYNSEWSGPPISFFSIEILSFMMSRLKQHYTIIYNRPKAKNIVNDNSIIYDLHEDDWIRQEHSEVLLMNDLFKSNRAGAVNFNHFQLMVYANADHFISSHGGTSTLASYFGGINLIFSKKGPEHHFKCFTQLYQKFSGALILHAKTEEELKNYIETDFIPINTQNTL